jgi:hypothetical protein
MVISAKFDTYSETNSAAQPDSDDDSTGSLTPTPERCQSQKETPSSTTYPSPFTSTILANSLSSPSPSLSPTISPNDSTDDHYFYIGPHFTSRVKPRVILHEDLGEDLMPAEPAYISTVTMSWDETFFAALSLRSMAIKAGTVFMMRGDLEGRWIAEAKVCNRGGYAFLRMTNNMARQFALVAFREESAETYKRRKGKKMKAKTSSKGTSDQTTPPAYTFITNESASGIPTPEILPSGDITFAYPASEVGHTGNIVFAYPTTVENFGHLTTE